MAVSIPTGGMNAGHDDDASSQATGKGEGNLQLRQQSNQERPAEGRATASKQEWPSLTLVCQFVPFPYKVYFLEKKT